LADGIAVSVPASRPALTRPHRRIRDTWSKSLFLLPAILFVIAFFAYPVIKNLVMGFQSYTTASFYTGESPFIGLANYARVISQPLFLKALANTLLFTAGSLLGQFVIGMGLALFFHRHFPLSNLLRSLLLLPWLLPLMVSSTSWKLILDKDSGVINQILESTGLAGVSWLTSPSVALTAVVIVNIWIGIPFNVAILYGGLQDIPEDLYEAASLDGATGIRAFAHVTWPLLRPVVTVLLVLGVVYTLKVVDIIIGLTSGGPANATQTIATWSYQTSFISFNFGEGAALSNILIIISLVFALLYLRVSRRGVDE
jgi:multiple sugar transport system permease protein